MRKTVLLFFVCAAFHGCLAPHHSQPAHPIMPSVEYSNWVKAKQAEEQAAQAANFRSHQQPRYQQVFSPPEAKAKLKFVKQMPPEFREPGGVVSNESYGELPNYNSDGYVEIPPAQNEQFTRDYVGPLALGDPGVSASLWKESRSPNELFRDYRAWKPMDLITIVVRESTEGKEESDTESKRESELDFGVSSFLGYMTELSAKNPNINPSALINAETTQDFKGEGETNRKGSLKGTISAMIVEILPSGILRFEGEKIVAVNGEEQVMVISGLVRTRDINSANEVESAKVANMRVDYYGRGPVNDANRDGWGSKILNRVWPF